MATGANAKPIREAVGIFFTAEHLRDALNELLTAGFKPEELGLLASAVVVERSLGDLYARTNESQGSPGAPAIAFIGKESTGQASALGGSLFFAGTSGAMGAVVASAAVLGGGLLAALGGVVAVGLVGAVVATVIHQTDAEFLQQHVDEGHILLFVRMADATREQQVLDILTRQSGTDVKMYEVPIVGEPPAVVPDVPMAHQQREPRQVPERRQPRA